MNASTVFLNVRACALLGKFVPPANLGCIMVWNLSVRAASDGPDLSFKCIILFKSQDSERVGVYTEYQAAISAPGFTTSYIISSKTACLC